MVQYFFGQSIINYRVLCDVEDICWGGSEQFQSTIIGKIRETFSISQDKITTFKYLGLNIKQTKGYISIDQNFYINEVSEVEINSERKLEKHAQLNKKEARQLRGLAEQFNWVSSQTRPDIAYNVCEVSFSTKNAIIVDITKANKNI